MKKRSWISTIITIAVLVAAFYIYKYRYLMSEYRDYYVFYEDVHGLQKSSPIMIDGVMVGRVSDIEFYGQDQVRVTLTIKKEVALTDSSVAQLGANGLVGDKMITLIMSDHKEVLKQEATLVPEMDTMTIFMSQQVEPIIANAQYQVRYADSNIQSFNRQIEEGLLTNISATLSRLNKDMGSFVKQVNGFKSEIDTTVNSIRNAAANTGSMVDNISHTNASIQSTLATTKKYAKPTLNDNLTSIKGSFTNIANAVNSLTNKDTGALAPLLNSKQAYTTATQQADTAKQAIEDIQKNPPVISIIGK